MEKNKFSLYLVTSMVVFVLSFNCSHADEYSFFGGIKRDEALKAGTYYYEEMCFMTGKPVLLKGWVTIPKKKNLDQYKLTYKYDLKSLDSKVQLSRNVTYTITRELNDKMNQEIINAVIESGGLKETVTLDDKVYNLTNYKFDNSIIRDLQPAMDFKSGRLYYEKVFKTDGEFENSGSMIKIIAESETEVGYKNMWSSVDTSVINQSIYYSELPMVREKTDFSPGEYSDKVKKNNDWQGNVKYKHSTESKTSFDYVSNNVQSISFRKGLIKSKNVEDVIEYEYDLPNSKAAEEGQPDRLRGEDRLDSYVYNESSMLPIPKYVDIGGYWAEKDIFQMASLGAFDLEVAFEPLISINREQFARAIANTFDSVDLKSDKELKSDKIKSKRPNAELSKFFDVGVGDKYEVFINYVNDKKIMIGEGNGQFLPKRPLTRAEAITVIVRALGIDDIAPILPFQTSYRDDNRIPNWAKPSIYMATKVGIVNGYNDNTIQPNKLVTRAEASRMLSNLIEYLREDITVDYREKLMDEM